MRRQSLLALLLIAIPASRNLPAPPVTGAEIAGNESGRSAAALGHRDESSPVCSADDRALTRGEDPYSSSLTLYEPKYREIKTEKEVEGDIHHVNNQAQDRIRNVKEDSNKINKKQEALTIQFESIKRSRKDVDRKLLEESRKIVEESQETLLILQEFRILELNNEGARGSREKLMKLFYSRPEGSPPLDNLKTMNDQVFLIKFNEAREKFMRNFIQRLQKLITDYNSLLNQKELNFKDENVFRDSHALMYVSKVFTFLKNNGFLSEENFRSTFQDHTFWSEAIYYYYKAFTGTNKYLGGTEKDLQYQSVIRIEAKLDFILRSMQNISKKFDESKPEDQELSTCISEFKKLFSVDEKHKFIDPILSDPQAFQGKLEQLILLVLHHPKLWSNEIQNSPKIMEMNISHAIFCLLGFVEEELFPGMITKLKNVISRFLVRSSF